ncbi:hypothetical protein CN587_25330 [Bacillus wiedmannii]|uniref:hypothetical protein n=1 Tax=Bacillus wiedmannii TaxID=1890302 RepID=UPI000BF5C5C0|nr:hypothetical protein [Bacillus wiedmannii]PEQ01548.1 hypothetical protein CN587_25330 [Bacillus wiedmannii]
MDWVDFLFIGLFVGYLYGLVWRVLSEKFIDYVFDKFIAWDMNSNKTNEHNERKRKARIK